MKVSTGIPGTSFTLPRRATSSELMLIRMVCLGRTDGIGQTAIAEG
jgi:hypothetical protein